MPYKDPQKNARLKRERYANDPEYRAKILAKNAARKQQNAEEYKDRHNTNARARYKRNRDAAIAHLGGKCVGCGNTHNLEFDHIDRAEKSANLAKLFKAKERMWEEVDKCQLLCKDCHTVKSRVHYDHQKLLKGCSLKSITDDGNTITIVYQK